MAFAESQIPHQKFYQEDVPFPQVFVPTSLPHGPGNDLVYAINKDKQRIEDALLRSCAILFRGFNINSASDFEAVVEALGYEPHELSGGAWLAASAPKVSKIDVPASFPLDYHNEGAYLKNPPSKMMFYCDVEPPAGQGATPIVHSRVIYEEMKRQEPEFVQELTEKKVLYSRTLNEKYQKTMLGSSDKYEAEKRAGLMDSWIEWLEDGGAVWHSNSREGIVKDEVRGGKAVWFNSITAMLAMWEQERSGFLGSRIPTYGDGSALPVDAMQTCKMLMNQHEVAIAWKKGDVLLIDNKAVMHSKQACFGERSVFVSLAA